MWCKAIAWKIADVTHLQVKSAIADIAAWMARQQKKPHFSFVSGEHILPRFAKGVRSHSFK